MRSVATKEMDGIIIHTVPRALAWPPKATMAFDATAKIQLYKCCRPIQIPDARNNSPEANTVTALRIRQVLPPEAQNLV